MLYIRFPELINLITGSVCPLTSLPLLKEDLGGLSQHAPLLTMSNSQGEQASGGIKKNDLGM